MRDKSKKQCKTKKRNAKKNVGPPLKNFFGTPLFLFQQPKKNCIGAIICIRQEIHCLLYGEIFLN